MKNLHATKDAVRTLIDVLSKTVTSASKDITAELNDSQ